MKKEDSELRREIIELLRKMGQNARITTYREVLKGSDEGMFITVKPPYQRFEYVDGKIYLHDGEIDEECMVVACNQERFEKKNPYHNVYNEDQEIFRYFYDEEIERLMENQRSKSILMGVSIQSMKKKNMRNN